MINELFTNLTHAIEKSGGVAISASFVWGLLSILLSPCHLASIPLVVGFISQQKEKSIKKAFAISLVFSTGILITIAVVGIITAMAGRILGAVGNWSNYFVAGVFFVIALVLLDIISLNWSGPNMSRFKGKGFWGAFIIGLVFGIAIGPCTFAYMAPMLAVVFKIAAERTVYSLALLLAYGIGHCGFIVLAGSCTEIVNKYMQWNEKSKATTIIKRICAILIIIAGLNMIYTAR
ncbi:MAG TPA: cytochrome c biogenesis protein CcdA [Sedimentisphaerales bacterium]|nr:cytochrome c biogenesis protein CcdA [Sedimentisphaerales bacterium]